MFCNDGTIQYTGAGSYSILPAGYSYETLLFGLGVYNIGSNNLAAVTFTNNGTLKLDGASGQTIPVVSTTGGKIEYSGVGSNLVGGYNYYDLKIDSGAYTAASSLRAYHNLENAGTLDMAGNNLTVDNAFTNTGTLKLDGVLNQAIPAVSTTSGTVEYSGVGTILAAYSYHNLKIDGGIYDVSGHALSVADTFTNSGTLQLTGNESAWTGSFNDGTIQYTGAGVDMTQRKQGEEEIIQLNLELAGGEGFTFEGYVAAYYFTALLAEAYAPGIDDQIVV